MPPNHWAYNPDVPRYPRDVARANQLLDEAGYPRGPEGIRLHLVYKTSADAFRVTVARIIASQLREVGIDVEIRSFEFSTFFSDVKKGNYQIATMQSTEITEPDFYMTFFHSTRWPTEKDPDGYNANYKQVIDFSTRLADVGKTLAAEKYDEACAAYDALTSGLSSSALWSLLIDVFARRAEARSPAELQRHWVRDSFTRPAPVDQRTLVELDGHLLANAEGFEALELSPLAPLGTCSAIGLSGKWLNTACRIGPTT